MAPTPPTPKRQPKPTKAYKQDIKEIQQRGSPHRHKPQCNRNKADIKGFTQQPTMTKSQKKAAKRDQRLNQSGKPTPQLVEQPTGVHNDAEVR